jgi:hypothetical protein
MENSIWIWGMMPTQETSNLLILEPIKFKEYPSPGTLE